MYLLLKDLAKLYTSPIWVVPWATHKATKNRRRRRRRW